MALAAIRTVTAAEDKGRCHPVAHPKTAAERPDFLNNAGKFMPRHMRQGDRIGAAPTVMVRAADAAGPDVDDDAVRRTGGVRYFADDERLAEGVEYGNFHEADSSRAWWDDRMATVSHPTKECHAH